MSFLINLLRTRHRGAGFREGPCAEQLRSSEPVGICGCGIRTVKWQRHNLDSSDHDQQKRFETHFSFEGIWLFKVLFELIPDQLVVKNVLNTKFLDFIKI